MYELGGFVRPRSEEEEL
jgi:hypothetical protein